MTNRDNPAVNPEINPYDETPYTSFPFKYTRPEHLRAVGMLFGMNPPEVETARVLELGCSSGGNIIGFASTFPKAKVIGVDLSNVQIEEGKQIIKALGLKNIELKAMSIIDIDKSFGMFDYIISHGVLSWVPEVVRSKILEISKTHLSPQGIAYISYNTLPGWNMARTTRDMMQFHSALFGDIKDQVAQSRLFLNFVKDALAGTQSPYEKFLEAEAGHLQNQSDYYLRHEHLSPENTQFYFHEIVDMAKKQGLTYLSDTNVASMYIGNLPEKARSKLSAITDIVRAEQYMDFINNRRFRCSLLCHDNVALNRSINSTVLDKMLISVNVTAEKALSDASLLDSSESLSFYINDNKESAISTSSPIMKAILYACAESNGYPTSPKALAKDATKKLKNVTSDAVKAEIDNNMPLLLLRGMINVVPNLPTYINTISSKPKVSDLVRFQASKDNAIVATNQVNDAVSINIVDRFALRYLDGKNTIEQIVDKLIESHVKSGDLVIKEGETPITDAKVLKSRLQEALLQCIESYRKNCLLVG
ncbi:MAG: class I SAM-dependent methyltransferase [Pseudomonadota bacterium]